MQPEQPEGADGEKVAGGSERNLSSAEWWSWVREDRRGQEALLAQGIPHPCQSFPIHSFFYGVLTIGPGLYSVLGAREPPGKPNLWLQNVAMRGSKANWFL